jgi:hypothetical protein
VERYRHVVFDSRRWDGFALRPGDVVISSPPKSGTTWMQTLCVMLVLGTARLDRPVSDYSPWLDFLTDDLSHVRATLDAQPHRRVIKTHTPLDGLPLDPEVTYIGLARDPRDAVISWGHHRDNLDSDTFMRRRAAVVGREDVAPLPPQPLGPRAAWQRWLDGPVSDFATLAFFLHHVGLFWSPPAQVRTALFHYEQLLTDLSGSVQRLADVLSVDASPALVDAITAEATFEQMRRRPELYTPHPGTGLWRSDTGFFHTGRSGQWRDQWDEDMRRAYDERVAELVAPDLAAWLADPTGRACSP